MSETHESLFADHFHPTLMAVEPESVRVVKVPVEQISPTGQASPGANLDPLWHEQIRAKVLMFAEATREELFVVSDVDIVFLEPWLDLAVESLGEAEMAWMGEPGISPAFYVGRGTPRLRAMADDMVVAWDARKDGGEGYVFLEFLEFLEKHGIDHHRLPTAFSNPGALGYPISMLDGKITFPLPEDLRVFHANFCSFTEKSTMLDQVRHGSHLRKRVGLGFFPETRPDRPFNRLSMLSLDKIRDILTAVGERQIGLIVEVGSWLGGSTRWFLETFNAGTREGEPHMHAQVICIDTWDSNWAPLATNPVLGPQMVALWEQWCANCWEWRHAITPIRLPSRDGIPAVARELATQDRRPDIVYIDGDHSEKACYDDIVAVVQHWPETLIIGDDYYWSDSGDPDRFLTVQAAGKRAAAELGRPFEVGSSGTWWMTPPQEDEERGSSRRPTEGART